jgi:hypothetical protein
LSRVSPARHKEGTQGFSSQQSESRRKIKWGYMGLATTVPYGLPRKPTFKIRPCVIKYLMDLIFILHRHLSCRTFLIRHPESLQITGFLPSRLCRNSSSRPSHVYPGASRDPEIYVMIIFSLDSGSRYPMHRSSGMTAFIHYDTVCSPE